MTNKKWLLLAICCIEVVALIILIYGLNVFWIGFHNVDLCHNEMIIQDIVNKKFNKLNVSNFIIRETKVYDGEIWGLSDCYRLGLKGMIQGFYISIVGAFILGLFWRMKSSSKEIGG